MYVVKNSRWRLSDKSTKISHNFPCCFVSPSRSFPAPPQSCYFFFIMKLYCCQNGEEEDESQRNIEFIIEHDLKCCGNEISYYHELMQNIPRILRRSECFCVSFPRRLGDTIRHVLRFVLLDVCCFWNCS